MSLEKVPLRQVDSNVVYTFSYAGNLLVEPIDHRLYNDTGLDRKITAVRASVGTASEGGPVSVYVKHNAGVNITGVTIPPGTHTSLVSGLSHIWESGSYLTVSIGGIGTTKSGADLTINVVVSE